MRFFNYSAIAISVALSACSSSSNSTSIEAALQSDATAIAYLENISSNKTQSHIDTEIWEQISGASDGLFDISYESLGASGNGQIAQNFKISLSAFPDIGLQADIVSIQGITADTLTALENNKPTKIADRIELTNVTYFGVAELMEKITEKSNQAAMDFVSNTVSNDGDIQSEIQRQMESQKTEFDRYDFSYGKITMDGLYYNGLMPALAAKEGESSDVTQIWDVVSTYARWSKAFNIDAMVAEDAVGHFIMKQILDEDGSSQDIDAQFKMPFMGMLGYREGDTRFWGYKDIDTQMIQTIASKEDDLNFTMNQGGTTGLMTVRDFKTSGLLDYLSKRKIPPVSATTILSLGKWHGEDMDTRMGEDVVAHTPSFDMDMSHFHWFIPTKLSFDLPEANYDLKALSQWATELFSTFAEAEGENVDAEQIETYIDQGMEILAAQDMENIPLAANFSYDWNPETGSASASIGYGINDVFSIGMNFDGAIGDFDSLATTFSTEDGFNKEALSAVLESQGAFSSASYDITDYGSGLDKIFSLVVDFAKLVPEGNAEQIAMLQNTDAKSLRLMASSMVRMGGMAANEQFPPAVKWINQLADFVQKGGKIEISAHPEKTVTVASAKAAKEAGVETPEQIIDFFGVKVTHDAPAQEDQ